MALNPDLIPSRYTQDFTIYFQGFRNLLRNGPTEIMPTGGNKRFSEGPGKSVKSHKLIFESFGVS